MRLMMKRLFLYIFLASVFILFNIYSNEPKKPRKKRLQYRPREIVAEREQPKPVEPVSVEESSIDVPISSFNLRQDFLVFFHIQKTSGTNFDWWIGLNSTILAEETGSNKEIQKRIRSCEFQDPTIPEFALRNRLYCRAKNLNKSWKLEEDNWYLSEKSIFYLKCGLHPYLTDMRSCVTSHVRKFNAKGKIFYVTMLREPVKRYWSEYAHTLRYQSESKNRIRHNSPWIFGRPRSMDQRCLNDRVRRCSRMWSAARHTDIKTFDLQTFVDCEANLAVNRQTRMLAIYDKDLPLCEYIINENMYEQEILKRAKRGLESMSFFGLAEYQYFSRRLFEKTFNNQILFDSSIDKEDANYQTYTDDKLNKVDRSLVARIELLNSLDRKLYDYAKELFFKRLRFHNITAVS